MEHFWVCIIDNIYPFKDAKMNKLNTTFLGKGDFGKQFPSFGCFFPKRNQNNDDKHKEKRR